MELNQYYELFIIDKLKKDITKELKNEKDDIIGEVINEYFKTYHLTLEKETDTYDVYENKTNVYRDREKYTHLENRCIARVWNCGMGGQCSRSNLSDGFCKLHNDKGGVKWWLGTINEKRPKDPMNHKGKIHEWKN